MAHPQLAPLVAAMDSHRDELVLAINNAAAPANPAAIQAAVTAAIAPLQAQLGAIQAQMLGGFAQMRNATRGEGIASPWEQVPNQQGQLPAAAHPAWPLLTNLGTLLGLTSTRNRALTQ